LFVLAETPKILKLVDADSCSFTLTKMRQSAHQTFGHNQEREKGVSGTNEQDLDRMISESEAESHIDMVDNAYAEIDSFENRQKYRESFKRKTGPTKPQMKISAKDGRVLQHYLQGV
jgi:hypothetical protein